MRSFGVHHLDTVTRLVGPSCVRPLARYSLTSASIRCGGSIRRPRRSRFAPSSITSVRNVSIPSRYPPLLVADRGPHPAADVCFKNLTSYDYTLSAFVGGALTLAWWSAGEPNGVRLTPFSDPGGVVRGDRLQARRGARVVFGQVVCGVCALRGANLGQEDFIGRKIFRIRRRAQQELAVGTTEGPRCFRWVNKPSRNRKKQIHCCAPMLEECSFLGGVSPLSNLTL